MDRSLPEISPRGLAGLDIVLPALAEIRIALTGGRGTAKFHVPPPDAGLRRYHPGTCQHSKPADQAATYALLEVFGRVCKKCYIVLPGAPDALWRAAAFAAHRREVLNRAEANGEPRTWLDYARNAARHEPGDDEQIEQWLRQARTDAALAADADTLAAAWRRLTADHRAFLDAYAANCPEVEAYNGARDAMRRSAGSEQRRALDQMSAAVGKASRTRERMYGPPPELDAGALVCGVWLAARSRGHSARRAADLARDAAAAELAGARVVDVTRLPAPPRTAGGAHESPSAWADAFPVKLMCSEVLHPWAGAWRESVEFLGAEAKDGYKNRPAGFVDPLGAHRRSLQSPEGVRWETRPWARGRRSRAALSALRGPSDSTLEGRALMRAADVRAGCPRRSLSPSCRCSSCCRVSRPGYRRVGGVNRQTEPEQTIRLGEWLEYDGVVSGPR